MISILLTATLEFIEEGDKVVSQVIPGLGASVMSECWKSWSFRVASASASYSTHAQSQNYEFRELLRARGTMQVTANAEMTKDGNHDNAYIHRLHTSRHTTRS